jgi:hypothetical protein
MNLKTLKTKIIDCDLQDLYEKINLFYKKNEILSHYFQILNINGDEKNMYLEDFSQIKTEPSEFRAACLRFVEKAHEDLKIHDLMELAKLF